MPRGTSWAISTPALRAATASARRGSRWNLSTRSGDGRQATAAAAAAAAAAAVQGAQPKMPRLTNRLRRLARAYPEAVAAISPAAVEESRAKYSAGVPRSEEKQDNSSVSGAKTWRKADHGTPEFFEWLNTIPADAAERLAKFEEDDDENEEDEEEGDAGAVNIGKTFLIPRARISLYDEDIFASGLLDARDKVLEARSLGQLRRAHERLRTTEASLHLGAGNYRTVNVGFEEPPPSAGLIVAPEGAASFAKVASRSRGAAGGGTKRVVYGPAETFAYVYHRMMPAYTVVHRVMKELKDELPDLNPSSVLDFGSGPGTAALATWDVWGMDGGTVEDEDGGERWEEGSRLSEVRLVEESQSMKDACKVMLEPLTSTGRVRVAYGNSLLDEARAAGRGCIGGAQGGKKFDLVVAAYSLSHLPTHASRAAATAVMWSLVAPGGVLVLVDDGTAKGSHTLRSAREMVLRPSTSPSQSSEDKVEAKGRGRGGGGRGAGGGDKGGGKTPPLSPYVVGPCRHDKECPLKTGEFCRFLQKVPWNAVDVKRSSVKSVPFSYVTIRKGVPAREAPQGQAPEAPTSSSSVDLLKAFAQLRRSGGSLSAAMDELGTDGICDASLRRNDWARLIRKPLKAKGHALLDVCTPEGSIQRKIVAKGRWKNAPGVFVAARKSDLGGLWPYLDDHDFKDYTAANAAAAAASSIDNTNPDATAIISGSGEVGLGLGYAEDGEGEDEEWGSEGWEPVVEVNEERGRRQGRARGGRMAEARRRRRDERAGRAIFD